MPALANIALGAVLGYIIQRTILKEAPKVVPKVKQTANEVGHRVVSILIPAVGMLMMLCLAIATQRY